MEYLPDPLTLQIFSFLGLRDLQRCSQVQKFWNTLANDPGLWVNVNLDPYSCNMDEDTLVRVISTRFSSMTRTLKLRGCLITSPVVRAIMSVCTRLEYLHLEECRLQTTICRPYGNPSSLRFLDLRGTYGYSDDIERVMLAATNIQYFGLYYCVPNQFASSIFLNKTALRVLDCDGCDWVTDETLLTIAQNCPKMESISLNKCTGITGATIKDLIANCKLLRTLLMSGTRIKDEALMSCDWTNCGITELDLLNCYRMSDIPLITHILRNLPQIRYLRFAGSDQSLSSLSSFPELEALQLHRRYPLTTDAIGKFLGGCPKLVCLDISTIPVSSILFRRFLPHLPHLQMINLAGNENLDTESIIFYLAHFCPKLEIVCLNYYHSQEEDGVKVALAELIKNCRNLKYLIINGNHGKTLVRDIKILAQVLSHRSDLTVKESSSFPFPTAMNCLARVNYPGVHWSNAERSRKAQRIEGMGFQDML